MFEGFEFYQAFLQKTRFKNVNQFSLKLQQEVCN